MSVRVLIAQLPRLLQDIVEDLLTHQPDIEVMGSGLSEQALPGRVATQHPDVVIVACEQDAVEQVARGVLGADPAKVLAVTRGGREACLFELQPRYVSLGEVSPSTLLSAIRSARGSP